jgi:hypothetical protein
VFMKQALDIARKVAAGIDLFRVNKPEGIAFPGDELVRLSCDFGTGSIGIAVFLNRLASPKPPMFHLDQTFERNLSRTK